MRRVYATFLKKEVFVLSNTNNQKYKREERYLDYRKMFLGVDVKFKLENGKEVIPIGFDNGATTPT